MSSDATCTSQKQRSSPSGVLRGGMLTFQDHPPSQPKPHPPSSVADSSTQILVPLPLRDPSLCTWVSLFPRASQVFPSPQAPAPGLALIDLGRLFASFPNHRDWKEPEVIWEIWEGMPSFSWESNQVTQHTCSFRNSWNHLVALRHSSLDMKQRGRQKVRLLNS